MRIFQKRVSSIALLILAVGCGNVKAQVGLNRLAQSTMNFLLVSISPVASAMGDAYYAVGTGAEAVFYNPAGMAEMRNTLEVCLDYTQWIADIDYYGGAFSWSLGKYGVVGLSALTVNYGTINATSLDIHSGYVDNGEMRNVGAYSFGFSYAKAVSTQFMAGGTIRYVGQNLGENIFADGTSVRNDATRFVFDLGVKYYTLFNDFRFGMAIRNFSSDITRELIAEQLPLTVTMGAAVDLIDLINKDHDKGTGLTLAVDFLHSNNYSERVNTGLEYKFLGMLALRGGYQTNRDIQSWSAGLGISTTVNGNILEVNYSFSKMETFNNVNRFSVAMSF